MTEAKTESKVGRTRPTDVIDRDEQVFKSLYDAGPATRAQLAERLKLDGKAVYLSLFRLRKSGRVTRESGDDRTQVWQVVKAA